MSVTQFISIGYRILLSKIWMVKPMRLIPKWLTMLKLHLLLLHITYLQVVNSELELNRNFHHGLQQATYALLFPIQPLNRYQLYLPQELDRTGAFT